VLWKCRGTVAVLDKTCSGGRSGREEKSCLEGGVEGIIYPCPNDGDGAWTAFLTVATVAAVAVAVVVVVVSDMVGDQSDVVMISRMRIPTPSQDRHLGGQTHPARLVGPIQSPWFRKPHLFRGRAFRLCL
jgi:hypothetical protein